MSDTDTPIMPSPNVIYASENSFSRFRHAFTTLQVFKLRDNGRRLEIGDDGHLTVFDLSADHAATLAALLKDQGGEP
jgi:hypothetical protein